MAALATQGIGANDRVAIVLDNGPEAASAFLSIGTAATAAPLNPSYRADEFEFYFTDLRAKLLVIAQGKESAAVDVATRLGVPIARLVPRPERGAGSFDLAFTASASSAPRATSPTRATSDDIALVLHTSGTTSRPKIVPLAHKNVCASAAHIRSTLALTADDCGLVIMPLFHIHGLVAALLAPLSAGGEVSCTSGFNALKFFAWMGEVRPTWYTGVPTMHQAILLRAPHNADVVAVAPAPIHPLVVVAAPADGDRRARARIRRAGDRGLRDDRGSAPDGEQSVAAWEAQARDSGARRRPRGARGRLARETGCRRHAGRDRDPRPERDEGVREQSDGERRGVLRRMVSHRRSGDDGCRGLPDASPVGSRRSSIAAARRFHRAKSMRSSCSTRPCISA